MPDRHPADIRWQAAYVDFGPAVQKPAASDMMGHDCKLIWVREDDWLAFMAWQRARLPALAGT